MEPETAASKKKRHAQRIRSSVIEIALAVVFLGAVFFADSVTNNSPTNISLRLVAVGLPIFLLTVWWCFYVRQISALDEFERSIATRSLAVACAVTIWITTAWGLVSLIVGVAALPLVMIAPLAALIYSLVRVLLAFGYR